MTKEELNYYRLKYGMFQIINIYKYLSNPEKELDKYLIFTRISKN